jgi:hypothetical protein
MQTEKRFQFEHREKLKAVLSVCASLRFVTPRLSSVGAIKVALCDFDDTSLKLKALLLVSN